jgi:hypothetical protein
MATLPLITSIAEIEPVWLNINAHKKNVKLNSKLLLSRKSKDFLLDLITSETRETG